MSPRHLYLHVPFCVRRCGYCDFAVTVDAAPRPAAWVDAVVRELELVAESRGWSRPWGLDTIYCGGGTPSLLGPGAMALLRERLHPLVHWDDEAEWTCEANPESFSADVARGWYQAGVNRISLGAQAFDEGVLRWMGRLHGPEGPGRALTAAREAGFRNVSVDLIFGLPARLGRDWGADLRQVVALAPEHVSLYGLTAEPATPLGRRVAAGRERLADETVYAGEYLQAVQLLEETGYDAYEVSNFSLPGLESRHNQAYWDGRAYLGLGPGAHSYMPPVRWWNVRDWHEYADRLSRAEPVRSGEESVSAEAESLEHVWLALRRREGLAETELSPRQEALADRWCRAGWAGRRAGRLRLTPEGWLRLDELAVELSAAAGVAGAPGGSLDSVIQWA